MMVSKHIFSAGKVFTRKLCSTQNRPFQEVKIPVPWGYIAGKWWSPYDKRPILTLHGWQDNCGSFDTLIPLLTQDLGFLAIDLPGHGYSSRLPNGMYYHNMDYPILIKRLQDHFEWPNVTLMGHSLGAISSFLYTMIFPESVDFLICLDGVKPLQKIHNAPRMAIGITEFLKFDEQVRSNEEPPSYTMEELMQIVKKGYTTVNNIDCIAHIAKRNIAPSKVHPGKFYFARDPRLKSRLILNWPHEDILEGGQRVKCPIFMSKFTESGYYENKQNFYDLLEVLKTSSSDCEYHYVEGKHHAHLENPASVACLLNKFIAKHNKGDRCMKNDIRDYLTQ